RLPPVILPGVSGGTSVQRASAHEPLPTPPARRFLTEQDALEEVRGGSVPMAGATDIRDVTMANVLATVAGRNPQVAFATQRYAEAYARLVAARVLWLPSINAGVGWNNHAGPLQASDGVVSQVARGSLTAGLGVQTIGAGSPVVPGLFANF